MRNRKYVFSSPLLEGRVLLSTIQPPSPVLTAPAPDVMDPFYVPGQLPDDTVPGPPRPTRLDLPASSPVDPTPTLLC